MAFKKEGAEFTDTVRFKDYALSFAAEEASRFSNEDGDVASAKVDFALSSAASLSASKHTAKIKELRRFLKSKEIKDAAGNNGTGTKGREDGVIQSTAVFKRTESEKGTRMNTTKKQITKEKRQAARKTAFAKMLRAKGMVGNELGTEKVTGDAFRDGNSGAVRAITEILNPATYLKSLFVKIAGVIAPHMMVVLLYLSVFMILVSLIAGMFTSINTVTTTVTGFISKYSGRGSIIAEESLDEEEIDEIVEDSGATGRQKDVIRYALSKVGYPYSQADRTSGSAYDCSSLAYYCWRAAGVDISYGGGYPPTAAAEASKLYSKGEVVNSTRLDIKDMEPGDLIFYGGHDNGRFLGIYHVAVYVGNGEVVEAFNEKHGVVYQTLRTKNIILVLRP